MTWNHGYFVVMCVYLWHISFHLPGFSTNHNRSAPDVGPEAVLPLCRRGWELQRMLTLVSSWRDFSGFQDQVSSLQVGIVSAVMKCQLGRLRPMIAHQPHRSSSCKATSLFHAQWRLCYPLLHPPGRMRSQNTHRGRRDIHHLKKTFNCCSTNAWLVIWIITKASPFKTSHCFKRSCIS